MVSLAGIRGNVANVASRAGNATRQTGGQMGMVALLGSAISFIPTIETLFDKHDSNGNEVSGLNYGEAAKQVPLDFVKAILYCGTAAAIAGPLGGGAVGVGAVAFILAQIAGQKLGAAFQETIPDRKEIIAEACKAKGISPDGTGSSITNSPEGVYG